MKVLRRRVPELRLIYNKHLEKKPGFEGKIVIEFTITPKGKITNISLVSPNQIPADRGVALQRGFHLALRALDTQGVYSHRRAGPGFG